MLDFAAVRRGERAIADLAAPLTLAELHALSDEMLDLIVAVTAGIDDADLHFVPHDPHAAATTPGAGDHAAGWTLAHVVTHMTAGAEEAAALAATLARGAEVTGRSRYEQPSERISSVARLHGRIAESRRMRHGLLQAWPDEPHLDQTFTLVARIGPVNAVSCFLLGLFHEDGHVAQLREIMRQLRERPR